MSFGGVSHEKIGNAALGLSQDMLRAHAIRRATEKKVRENDPGFWGTVGKQAVDSSTTLHVAERLATKYFKGDDFSPYADGDYNWKEDAAKYAAVYPREVFEGSRSSHETGVRIGEYEKGIYERMAMRDHPLASFFGRCFGFGVDLAVVRRIPFVGGLNIAAETAAERVVSNSILKGAVRNGVSFALDMGEVGVYRALADDRVTFGEAMENVPEEMMVGALLGAALGGGVAATKEIAGLRPRVVEQVREGTRIPQSPALGNDTYGSAEEYENLVRKQGKALAARAAEHGIIAGGDGAKDTMENFVRVVGGVGLSSATEQASSMALTRLAFDRLTRAFASDSETVRAIARRLHDNHLVGGSGELSLDVIARTATNRYKGAVAKIVDDTFQKISDDKNLPPLPFKDVKALMGNIHLNGGEVPSSLDPQLAAIVNDAYSRLKTTFFESMETTFLDMQKMVRGPALLEQSQRNVATAAKNFETVRASLETFEKTREEMVAGEISRATGDAERGGQIHPEDALGKSLARETARVRKKYDTLRKSAIRGSGDYATALDAALASIGESKDGTFPRGITNMLSSAEKGTRTMEQLIGTIDAMEETEIISANKLAEDALATRRKFLESTRSVVEKKYEVAHEKMARDVEAAEEKLAYEKALLEDRASGKFSKDSAEFLQKEDSRYIRRIYDIPKIMRYPEKFLDDITQRLGEVASLSEGDAREIAHHLYNELINGYGPGNRYSRVISERGVEKARAFHFPTEVVREWLVDDIQELANSMADTIIPDYLTMKHVGSYEAAAFRDRIISEADSLVASGKLKMGDRKAFIDGGEDTIQALIDNVRFLGKLPPGALKSSRAAWQASAIATSLTTAVTMGGAPFLAIFDAASTVLNKGFFSTIGDDFVPFFRYVSNKRFRNALRNHPDMVALSGWLEVMTKKGSLTRMSDYNIPVGMMTTATESARALAEFQFKWTGARALFNAMHMVADYGSLLTLARISEKAAIGTALSATERNILSLARISAEDAVKMGKLIGKHGSKENGVRYLNFDGWEDAELAFRMQYGANNVTMNSILLPGSEVPKAVRSPLGELIFQYKKFFFSAVDRCFLPAINRLAEGELAILSRVFLMVMMGGFKEQLSRMAGGREPLDFHDFWMYGIGNSDVLPFVGEMIKDVGLGFHSGGMVDPTISMGKAVREFFVPPAAAIVAGIPTALAGTAKLLAGNMSKISRAEANAMKRSLPFNNTIYLNFLLNKLKRCVGKENYHDIYR